MSSTGLSVSEMAGRQVVPYERMFGVLAQTHVEDPRWDRWHIGGAGLRSTVPNLVQFLIAHKNGGRAHNDGRGSSYRLLQPETVAFPHRQVVQGGGDLMMVGTGMGWSHHTNEVREMWGKMIDLRGMEGHRGAESGYRASMFLVEGNEGSYG
jgi:hypothetical protein